MKEWFQLFISISIPVAIAVYTVVENNRDLSIARRNREQNLSMGDNQRQDLVIQECLKIVTKLIEKYGSEFNRSSSISLVARFAVLSTLTQVDRDRRNYLVRLLFDAKLITYRMNDYQSPVSLHLANLTGLNLLEKCNVKTLFHLSLENILLTNANFHESNIHGGRFTKSILINADFSSTRNSLSFDDDDDEIGCRDNSPQLSFTSALFLFATYDNADFTSAIMINTNLYNFFCENCLFISTSMDKINLQNGSIQNSSFSFATLHHANLYQTSFSQNVDFYEGEMEYVYATYTKFVQCDLTSAKLFHTISDHSNFINTSFSNALMMNVSMQFTKIIHGNFTNTDLRQSNWRYAYCERCIFDHTNLTNADLYGVVFNESYFRNSMITNEQFKQMASFERSVFINEE